MQLNRTVPKGRVGQVIRSSESGRKASTGQSQACSISNNVASAGACRHAGEAGGGDSWYEYVLAAHYPRDIQFNSNLCQDGRMD